MKHIHDEYTQDMFGRPLTGLELGHAMAKVAADHAGNEWKNLAYESFVEYAKHHRKFTTEQARGACLHVPPPPDKRAWGQVALRARKNDIIESAGWTRAESKSVHGMVVTLWRSKINH
jgi:hypothetical protein